MVWHCFRLLLRWPHGSPNTPMIPLVKIVNAETQISHDNQQSDIDYKHRDSNHGDYNSSFTLMSASTGLYKHN